MLGNAVLTKGEFQLLTMIAGRPALPGMEAFAPANGWTPTVEARNRLLSKGLLQRGEGGRFRIDPTVGYLFSRMAGCDAYLRGAAAFADGCAALWNLYAVDDAFVLVSAAAEDEIEYRWLPTFQLAMGAIFSALDEIGETAGRATLRLSDNAALQAQAQLKAAAQAGLPALAAVWFETAGNAERFAGLKTAFAVDDAGNAFEALPDADGRRIGFPRRSIAELFAPIGERMYQAHAERIQRILARRGEAEQTQ